MGKANFMENTEQPKKKIIDPMAFDQDPKQVLEKLESAAKDLLKTIDDMKAGPRDAQHYEQQSFVES